MLPPSAPQSDETKEEIRRLQTMMLDERPDALGEIFAQADEFMSYFFQLLGGNQVTHPATFRVLTTVNMVGTFVAMYFKALHNRPRPSHLCPALLPPIQVPGHASYPSGHSTQAHLFAECLKSMLPGEQQESACVVLNALADRIARNREIAGVHYRSDSTAGARLAHDILQVLSDESVMPHDPGKPSRFKAAMDRAKSEWA